MTGLGGNTPARSAWRNGLPITASERLWARRDGGITEVLLRWQLGDEARACTGYGDGDAAGRAWLLLQRGNEVEASRLESWAECGWVRASAGDLNALTG